MHNHLASLISTVQHTYWDLQHFITVASLLFHTIGDRLVKVNGASIIGKAYCEVISLIQERSVELKKSVTRVISFPC